MAVMPLIRVTVADSLRQPLTWVMTGLSLAAIGLSVAFGAFTFQTQDRLRMLTTAGVAVAILNGLFLAVAGAGEAIHGELADRTALTLFAKPMARADFLIGKAIGIWLTVAASSLVIAAAHAAVLAWALQTGFELDPARRGWVGEDQLWVPWGTLAGAHVLALAHSAICCVLASVLALRFPLLITLPTCLAIFVLGHVCAGLGWLWAGPLPALALFDIDDSLQFLEHPLSPAYFGLTLLYTLLYCVGSICLGVGLLRHQDIS